MTIPVPRTVLTFERSGVADTIMKLDAAQGLFPGQGMNVPVNLGALPGGSLQERGQGIDQLLRTNPAINSGLSALLARVPSDPPAPVYFYIRTDAADAVAWEQIFTPGQGFCALDARWPIGRIAMFSPPPPPRDRDFTQELRIVAVLSAVGRKAGAQLDVLLKLRANASLPISLRVISGDDDVLTAARDAGVTADLIAPTAFELAHQIADAHPHILHVLCHGGGTASGLRILAFGARSDFEEFPPNPANTGSIRMSATQLATALLPVDPWRVVLASCQSGSGSDAGEGGEGGEGGGAAVPAAVPAGGAAVPVVPVAVEAGVAAGAVAAADAAIAAADPRGALAAAHEMVNAGIPAVIGMRRLVDLTATNRFCRVLYPELVRVVSEAVGTPVPGAPPPTAVIDWAPALTAPRAELSAPDPGQVDAWTDPVLYARFEALRVRSFAAPAPLPPVQPPPVPPPLAPPVAPPPPAPSLLAFAQLRGQLDQLADFLNTQDPDNADPALTAEVRQRVQQLEASLVQLGGPA